MKRVLLVFVLVWCWVLSSEVLAVPYFQNPSFETGDLSFWSYSGIVSVITGDSYVSSAYDGNYMVLLSNPGDPNQNYSGGGYVYDNWISQTIDAFNGEISFWYNLFTTDYDYDRPAFMVKINNQEVLKINAEDVLNEWSDPVYYTGWTQFTYDVSSFSDPITITIYAGNTCDNFLNSWAYIDFFSPGPPTSPGGGAPVPEPATGLLLLSAFPALYFWRKKRS